jgi:ribosomal protein S18 acetylase RimI-like enzyme
MIAFREADVRDAPFLVPLIAEASGGTWPAVWRACANKGESIEASGARYLVDLRNKLSVENTIVAELEGARIGMMCRYQERSEPPDDQVALPGDLTTALAPYRQLTDPDSLFIAELCCLERSRGQGLGTRFVDRARQEAIASALPRVTLRVFSENTGAVRLYERCGFKVVDKRAVIAHPDIAMSGSVLLMSCDV